MGNIVRASSVVGTTVSRSGEHMKSTRIKNDNPVIVNHRFGRMVHHFIIAYFLNCLIEQTVNALVFCHGAIPRGSGFDSSWYARVNPVRKAWLIKLVRDKIWDRLGKCPNGWDFYQNWLNAGGLRSSFLDDIATGIFYWITHFIQ